MLDLEPFNLSKLFPTVIIALDLIAAAIYCSEPNIKNTIYYFAAAVLTFAVTFIKN